MAMLLFFTLMIIVSVAWVIWFLYHPFKNNNINLNKSNTKLGMQKNEELVQDLQRDLITTDTFNKIKNEVADTLALELNQTNKISNQHSYKISYWTLGFILLFLPILSLTIYKFLAPQYENNLTAQSTEKQSLATFENSVFDIKKHLLDNPDDFQTWQILGSTLFELNKIKEALKAYETSYKINPNNLKLLLEYAYAIVFSNNKELFGKAKLFTKKALEINPNSHNALYLEGIIALKEQQLELAVSTWQRALSLLPKEHPEYILFENLIKSVSTYK